MKYKLKINNQKLLRMKSKIQTILRKTQFFSVTNSTNNGTYTLEKPSQIVIRNIYVNWLRYLNLKTHKFMPIYIQRTIPDINQKTSATPPFGIINHKELEFKSKTFEIDVPSKKLDLELKLIVPQQDFMQYFIQWQRYRKYWWSNITTTPSLFAVGDIIQNDTETSTQIVAKLSCGPETVEHIIIRNHDDKFKDSACLTCTMSLERALLILLLDGLSNDCKDEYLRLHRKIAPYKMSFALDFEDLNNKGSLMGLATLLCHRLNLENISVSLPDFTISLEEQIKENLRIGIPYTAILNENTLQNGIFHLLSSSTMLKEQLHVADFHKYAALICNHK